MFYPSQNHQQQHHPQIHIATDPPGCRSGRGSRWGEGETSGSLG